MSIGQRHASASSPNSPSAEPVNAATAPSDARLTQEEKLLAAGSYVAWVMGFWLIGPIVIYALYREKSRYVAFHAIQSIIVSVCLTLLVPLLLIGGLVVVFLVTAATGDTGPLSAVMMFLLYALCILAALVPMVFMVIGAWRAFNGQRWRFPIAWRLAKRFTKDDGQSPHQPSPFQNIYPGAKR